MNQQLRLAQNYISEHITDDLTLDAIADVAGYSAYHFARLFKSEYGVSVMDYVRSKRLECSKLDLANGLKVIDVAMKYEFDTHAGFTRAFSAEFGCTPAEFAAHAVNLKGQLKMLIKENSKIIVRPVCKDDLNDLWEHVYSAMTPRQITDVKILPMIERELSNTGLELVASVDSTVVLSLPMHKVLGLPLGILYDNNFEHTEGEYYILMEKILVEMKRQCKRLNISALLSPQRSNTASVEAFTKLGFTHVFAAGGFEYLMMAVE